MMNGLEAEITEKRRQILRLQTSIEDARVSAKTVLDLLRKVSYTAPWALHQDICQRYGWTPRNVNVWINGRKVRIKMKPGMQLAFTSWEFGKLVYRVLTYTSDGVEAEITKSWPMGGTTTCYRYWDEKGQCWTKAHSRKCVA